MPQGTSNVGSNPTPSTSYSSALAASLAQQQQSHSKHSQQSQMQMPSAADLSLLLSLGMGGLDASQLANLDLQKLAMYLVSIENPQTKLQLFILYVKHKLFSKFSSKFNSHEKLAQTNFLFIKIIIILWCSSRLFIFVNFSVDNFWVVFWLFKFYFVKNTNF